MLDVHPMSLVFHAVQDGDGKADLRPVYSYFPDPAGILDDGERPTYAGTKPIKTPVYEWQHSLSEVVNALLGAGLTIEYSQASSQWRRTKRFRTCAIEDGWWRLPERDGSIAFLFSIKARCAV